MQTVPGDTPYNPQPSAADALAVFPRRETALTDPVPTDLRGAALYDLAAMIRTVAVYLTPADRQALAADLTGAPLPPGGWA